MKHFSLLVLLLAISRPLVGGEADVLAVEADCDNTSVCRFSVTVQHADTGWDHYANRWEVLDTAGNVLGVRELAHPHVDEQPFTRSLGGVRIPAGVSEVVIRARDSVHGYGGSEQTVTLKR